MTFKISSALDTVADSLESRGLIKEAYEIDKIANSMDKVADVAGQVGSLLGINKIPNMNLRDTLKNHMYVILDLITKHLSKVGKEDVNVTNKIIVFLKRCDQQITLTLATPTTKPGTAPPSIT